MNTENSNQDNENDFADEEIIQDFLNETNEGLQQLEVDFVTLEKEPQNTDVLNNAFRVIHTIKGTAGFLGFKNLGTVSHKAEDVLNKLRKSELNLSADITDTLLSAIDIIKQIVDEIEQYSRDTSVNTEVINNRLENISNGTVESVHEGHKTEDKIQKVKDENQKKENGKQDLKDSLGMEEVQISSKQLPQDTSDSLQKKESEGVTPEVNLSPEHQTPGAKLPAAKPQTKKEKTSSIRIDIDKLDSLFNLVGELVLSRNRNVQLYRLLSERFPTEAIINYDMAEAGNHLDHLTSELQSAVMKTRMMPISTVFNKFRRVVRDIGKTLGKEIELHIMGDNTEIDKNIIEGIGDPMTHLIRNSADHGIEMPGEREKASKNRVGRIDLNAYYEGDYVVIEINDDGKGIDVEAVKKKALEKGLITLTEADNMPKTALFDLILEPGFSTAQKVSAVSGRGVGMDVVKTKIEGLRGQIIIDSEVGVGSNIKLKIPLTMAILDTIIVNVGDHKYAVPLSNVVKTHKMKYNQIEMLRGNTVFRMSNELMPVVTLSEIINLPFKYDNNSNVTMLVLRNGLFKMGIVVDNTAEQEEVVIKSIDCLDGIAEPKGVSGATILGDGSITFILDVNALMDLANAVNIQAEANVNEEKDTSSQSEDNLINVVMVENHGKEQYVIPARNVKEIEVIQKTDIEEVGGILVIKYRGRIISLTDIPSITKVAESKKFKNYYMIILADERNEVGLLVGSLLGIKQIDEDSFNKEDIKLNGIIGSTIFEGRITLLLNPEEVKTTALNQHSLSESVSATHST